MDASYISQHLARVNSVEPAWGQGVARAVLEEAIRKLGNRSSDSETVQINFTVTEYKPQQCVRLCLSDGHGGEICTHVGIRL